MDNSAIFSCTPSVTCKTISVKRIHRGCSGGSSSDAQVSSLIALIQELEKYRIPSWSAIYRLGRFGLKMIIRLEIWDLVVNDGNQINDPIL
jgi:hypothetical protein